MRGERRQIIRQRYVFRCGYCGIRERDAGAELTIDHFQPRSQGGTDDLDNLVYCCHACNEYKGDFWQPDSASRLLHPLRDEVERHIKASSDGLLIGRTETGRFHIQYLQLNRPGLVAHRQEQHDVDADRALLRSVDRRMTAIERQNELLLSEVQRDRDKRQS